MTSTRTTDLHIGSALPHVVGFSPFTPLLLFTISRRRQHEVRGIGDTAGHCGGRGGSAIRSTSMRADLLPPGTNASTLRWFASSANQTLPGDREIRMRSHRLLRTFLLLKPHPPPITNNHTPSANARPAQRSSKRTRSPASAPMQAQQQVAPHRSSSKSKTRRTKSAAPRSRPAARPTRLRPRVRVRVRPARRAVVRVRQAVVVPQPVRPRLERLRPVLRLRRVRLRLRVRLLCRLRWWDWRLRLGWLGWFWLRSERVRWS